MIMHCGKCGDTLTGNQKRWCSLRCSRLGLKSEWRKRNRKRLNEYSRNYRRAKNGGNTDMKEPARLREKECLNCGSVDDLQLAHVKPLWAGGVHKHVITLCRKCHHNFDNLLREFWNKGLEAKIEV